VNQMLQLDPDTYATAIQQHIDMVSTLDDLHESKKGSILQFCSKNKKEEALAHAARNIERRNVEPSPADIYVLRVLSRMVQKQMAAYLLPHMISPIFGAVFFGATLSWNSLPFEPNIVMVYILFTGTILFQIIFILVALILQERNTLNVFIDLCFGVVSLFFDWYWFHENKWGRFESVDLVIYSIIVGFMVMRLWYSATNPDINPIQRSNERRLLVTLDKLHLVWITRSTADVFEIYPEILSLWDELCSSWGLENARKMCQISIYCTDKSRDNQEGLARELKETSLMKEGSLKFGRPKLDEVIETQSEDNMATRSASHTLVVFCGGQSMARRVKEAKILNDITLNITGNAAHEVDLVIESYGGESKREAPKKVKESKAKVSPVLTSDNKRLQDSTSISVLTDNEKRSQSNLDRPVSSSSRIQNFHGASSRVKRRHSGLGAMKMSSDYKHAEPAEEDQVTKRKGGSSSSKESFTTKQNSKFDNFFSKDKRKK